MARTAQMGTMPLEQQSHSLVANLEAPSRVQDRRGRAIKGNRAACSSHPWSSCRTSDASPHRGGSASCMRTSSCNPPWRQRSPTPWTFNPSLPVRPILDGSIDPDFGGRRWTGSPTPPTRKTTAHCNGPNKVGGNAYGRRLVTDALRYWNR